MVSAAFTDHLAVIQLSLDTPLARRGQGYWKMNTTLLDEAPFKDKLRKQWAQWLNQGKHYSDRRKWRGSYAKKKISQLFMQEGTVRR